jgi:hypothetical protein
MGLLYKSHLSNGGEGAENAPVLDGNARKEIDAYIARHPQLWGFIFDADRSATEEETEILAGLVKGAVSSVGVGARLQTGKILVLVPASQDPELVAHRVGANFHLTNSYLFTMTGNDDIARMIPPESAVKPAVSNPAF